MALNQAEALSAGLARELQPVVGLTLEQRTGLEIAQVVEQGNVIEGAKIGARVPVDREKSRQRAAEIGGYNRNPNTGEVRRLGGSPAETRYNDVNREINLTADYLEKGYDGLPPVQKAILRDRFINAAMLSPLFAKELSRTGITPAQKRVLAERILKDPRYASNIRTLFDNLSDPNNPLIENNDTAIKQKRDELELEKTRRQQVQVKRDTSRGRVEEVEKKQKAATSKSKKVTHYTPAETQVISTLQLSLKLTETDIVTIDGTLSTDKATLGATDADLAVIAGTPNVVAAGPNAGKNEAALKSEIAALKSRNRYHEGRLVELNAKKADALSKLETAQAGKEEKVENLDAQKEQAQEKLATDELALKTSELKIQQLQQELTDMLTRRINQENDMVSKFTTVFSEAGATWIDEEIDRLNAQLTTELDTLKEKMKGTHQESLRKGLQNQLVERVKKRGRERPVIRKEKARDYANILVTQGPEGAMKAMLMSQTNPETGAAYTQNEADAVLADSAFTTEMKPQVIKQILGRHIMANGIDTYTIDAIERTDWGKGMVVQALEDNKNFRDTITKVAEAGGLDRGHIMRRFGQIIREHPWLLVLLLAGGTVAGVGGAVVLAGLVPGAMAIGAGVGAGTIAGGEVVGAAVRAGTMHPSEDVT